MTYRTGEAGPGFSTTKPTSFEATPLVVEGVMYVGTPLGRVIALDPATGVERWVFDPKVARNVPYGDSRPAASRPGSTRRPLRTAAVGGGSLSRRPNRASTRSMPGAAHRARGATNAWSVLAADPARDLVFVPTSSAAPDYFGGLRLGDNRYANSIVALRASTGKVVWAFQIVHHDLWDYDNASPPALVTLVRDGKDVPAVIQANKNGMVYVLDRETGVPIFGVEERQVPSSDSPGEVASPTQPFSVEIAPLSPHRFTTDDARLGLDYEYSMMNGTPYVMRRRILRSPSQLPCTPPPFGSLVAVDLRSGAHLWNVPLGSLARLLPAEAAARIPPEWGSPNLGGPIVTAGGLVFIGAALDRFLRAFDVETGKELWRGALPESAKATPMSYRLASGEQFVAVAVGGGGPWGEGDYVVAFRFRR